MKTDPRKLRNLQKRLPTGDLRLEASVCQAYASDKWFASRVPDAVALPRTTDSISRLLAFAHRHRIPVTARGSGHGYVGGCVPVRGGIVLGLERMNRIREIHREDFIAVVEPGVITAQLQDAVEAKRLYYPPDPASRADCTIGGNIVTNAGGPRCLKYGVTRDYVLGLEVVKADGTVLQLGSRTHKNKSGFELARLFVGSEGLLGVITEATLKLIPLPPYRACLGVGFGSMTWAAKAIRQIFGEGILPSALEIADSFTLAAAQKRTGSKLLEGCQAHLIIELDGQERSVRYELQQLARLLGKCRPVFVRKGYGQEGCERFWSLRREFSYSLRDTGLTKLNEDIVVPRGRLEDLFRFTARLQRQVKVPIACFGHAGDGNVHVNVMVDREDAAAMKRSEEALDLLFAQIHAWGGVITGEHGVGLAKKRWWPKTTPKPVQQFHRDLRRFMDPHGILNPGKFV